MVLCQVRRSENEILIQFLAQNKNELYSRVIATKNTNTGRHQGAQGWPGKITTRVTLCVPFRTEMIVRVTKSTRPSPVVRSWSPTSPLLIAGTFAYLQSYIRKHEGVIHHHHRHRFGWATP